ncbi:C45 family autoproteolytic acyltransferase/hydolase [Botrimarina hoheduenensis]|uniref:Acyl-coenzyme A:6-aminopenicillanic acid acyl-transferase n=1 Tax=Botrimarina hoheduenensis TaxID=2528000 RepID=A0A5C5WCQ1_9BACT|nr:C45 family peptidase [Botrimarina hoheduenensis]TWT47831.1 Acyl-coenzyme A:6-aminopenicillanic acid acyl-transferase [Botrimarina hoheduenensis]
MQDEGFPIIEYRRGATPREWGRAHGEAHREGIQELFEIRLALMQEKNGALTPAVVEQLAGEQWDATEKLDPLLADELLGIGEGAGLTNTQLVVVNNYTDFRDIQPGEGTRLQDEGCSAVFVDTGAGAIAGQTWDMHGSAKRFVCCLDVPVPDSEERMVVFSIVGCLGMMGYTSWRTAVGVNNINTDGARPGVVWPALVRKTLAQRTHDAMVSQLKDAAVTSGHNYLVASRTADHQSRAEMWEVMPDLAECASRYGESNRRIYHTNHCLAGQAVAREQAAALNSSTHIRYDLIEKKINAISSFDDVYALLNDHENYPQSICSNHQTSALDPAITCGGAVGDLTNGRVTMWRGDELYDDNFVRHEFRFD